MITLQDVTKKFGDKSAVNGVSLEIKTGEVIGFLGLNGAGKTTTMRLITGFHAPTTGTVKVDGHNPIADHLVVAHKVGYLPENNPLYPDMTVREYLSFVQAVKGKGDISSIAIDVGLTEMMHKKIEQLSRGYKQRVGLAAALLGSPSILVLDEPTSGLDPIEQEKIRALIMELAKTKIIIFSTHILSEVSDVATRLIIIHEGRVVYDGDKPHSPQGIEDLFKKSVMEAVVT